MTPTVRSYRLDDRARLDEIAAEALHADGVAPLNEASLLALDHPAQARVLVASEGTDSFDENGGRNGSGEIVAVFVDAAGDGSSCDLVCAPASRRRGAARALVEAARGSTTPLQLWAHGDLPAARACAKALGFTAARSLWVMSRPLAPQEEFAIDLPGGLVARPFDGSEAQARAWLDVNARAFAHHPEQGRMTMADFTERTSQPWFDPAGLILVWDEASGTLAASHWAKREPGSETGEVYVVAVAPEYQGRGIAGPLTNLGLAHLRDAGASVVELYVDGDNEPAKATYARQGFTRAAHDVMYVHAPTPTM